MAILVTLKSSRLATHQVERGPLSSAKIGGVTRTIQGMGSRCTGEIGGSSAEDEG